MNDNMSIKIGSNVIGLTVSGDFMSGEIVDILVNVVVVKSASGSEVLRKKDIFSIY